MRQGIGVSFFFQNSTNFSHVRCTTYTPSQEDWLAQIACFNRSASQFGDDVGIMEIDIFHMPFGQGDEDNMRQSAQNSVNHCECERAALQTAFDQGIEGLVDLSG